MEFRNGIPCFSDLTDYEEQEIVELPKEIKELEEICFCGKHGEYKSHTKICDGVKIPEPCPKCEQEKEDAKRRLEMIQKSKEANVEPEFHTKTLDDFITKTNTQKLAKEAVKKLMVGKINKVVLLGSNGLGKTMLASIAARELGGKIYSMYEISAMIRQSFTNKAIRSELEIVNELASVPFLAIDELGRTKGSEAELNWLSYVLDKRHTRKLPFMILSNCHTKANCKEHGCSKCFENYVGTDILSRLQQDSVLVEIIAPDGRGK